MERSDQFARFGSFSSLSSGTLPEIAISQNGMRCDANSLEKSTSECEICPSTYIRTWIVKKVATPSFSLPSTSYK